MKLLIVTNNPDRASFKQRIGIYLDALQAGGIDCEVAKLPAGSLARRKLFKRAADFDGVFLHKKGFSNGTTANCDSPEDSHRLSKDAPRSHESK